VKKALEGEHMQGERKLAAIMFTDIVGYTSLAQSDEKKALSLLEEHRALLRPVFEGHGGRVVKTMGDAFLVEFASALKATECAAEVQKLLHERNRTRQVSERVEVRIGIHAGELVERDGDIYGDAVNIASRIEPLAEPGGIRVTEQVYDHIKNKTTLKVERSGAAELKNIRAPVEIYRVVPSLAAGESEVPSHLESRRVAVLPFTNISQDREDEYFADGLTEELISTMSRVKGLSVISRTSVMQYKGKAKSIAEIGRELNAGTILEGSVRRAGNRLRISIQMIDAAEDRHVWAESYDREFSDVFAVQSEIAEKVAGALEVSLLAHEMQEIGKQLTKNSEAHMLYLKAISHINLGSPRDVERGIEYLKLAADEDPSFALAHTKIAEAYVGISDESIPASEGLPKAKEHVSAALSLDDRLAEAHNVLALIAFQYDWNWPLAEAEFKRAIALNSNLADAHMWYARFLAAMGRFQEAIPEASKARDLDPLSPFVWLRSWSIFWMAGRNDEARRACERILEIQPKFARAHAALALVEATAGRAQEALSQVDIMLHESHEAYFQAIAAMVYALTGKKEKANEVLDGLLSNRFGGYASPVFVSQVYYLLGDANKGYEWLHKAVQQRSTGLPMGWRWPIWRAAEADVRYITLTRDIGLT
jgi:adenylate cyclase